MYQKSECNFDMWAGLLKENKQIFDMDSYIVSQAASHLIVVTVFGNFFVFSGRRGTTQLFVLLSVISLLLFGSIFYSIKCLELLFFFFGIWFFAAYIRKFILDFPFLVSLLLVAIIDSNSEHIYFVIPINIFFIHMLFL